MAELFYRKTFSRAIYKYVINGFFARDIDADDWEFLEYVRKRGCANGSLPSSSAVLIEELEFWHLPYTLAPDVERHIGRRPRQQETPEQIELRKARRNRWHALRAVRAQERAIAAAELEREQREYKAANLQRALREAISDAEWHAAAPQAPFGTTVKRHHVPEWKLEEQRAEAAEKKRLAQEKAAIREEERLRKLAQAVASEQAKAKEHEQEQARKQAALQEARANLANIERMEQQKWGTIDTLYPAVPLRDAIMTLLNRTPGYAWSGQEMMRALGCIDAAQFNAAVDELVASGTLRTTHVTHSGRLKEGGD